PRKKQKARAGVYEEENCCGEDPAPATNDKPLRFTDQTSAECKGIIPAGGHSKLRVPFGVEGAQLLSIRDGGAHPRQRNAPRIEQSQLSFSQGRAARDRGGVAQMRRLRDRVAESLAGGGR